MKRIIQRIIFLSSVILVSSMFNIPVYAVIIIPWETSGINARIYNIVVNIPGTSAIQHYGPMSPTFYDSVEQDNGIYNAFASVSMISSQTSSSFTESLNVTAYGSPEVTRYGCSSMDLQKSRWLFEVDEPTYMDFDGTVTALGAWWKAEVVMKFMDESNNRPLLLTYDFSFIEGTKNLEIPRMLLSTGLYSFAAYTMVPGLINYASAGYTVTATFTPASYVTPVPEPITFTLLCLGLGSVLIFKGKKY